MKRSLLLFILITASYVSQAQLKVGFYGGANRSTVLETNDLPNWSNIKPNYSPLYGFHGGVFAEIPLNKKGNFVLQPGAAYFNKGRKYKEQFDTLFSLISDSSSTLHLNYIDIPFNFVVKFNLSKKLKFMIGAGPYVSFFFKGNEKTTANYINGTVTTTSNTDLPVGNGPGKLKTMDYGANVMAGFEMGHVFLRAEASQSLGDFYKANYNGSFKHQVIGVSLGFTIDLKNPTPEKKKPAEPKKPKEPKKIKEPKEPKEPKKAKEPKSKVKDKDKDSDGDGVPDKDDQCPFIAGLASNNGCPVKDIPSATKDTDGDGINDDVDKCPTVPGLLRYDGCPIPDTDGDGVNDEIDHCKTVPGLATNHGCPEKPARTVAPEKPKVEITEEMTKTVEETSSKIQFKQSQWDLSPEAMKALDAVAGILQGNPALRLQIDGYASKEGDHYTNLGVSNARANAVRDYLVSKGIDKSRLKVAYYGADKLLTGEEAKQDLNRRVEMRLY